MGGGPLAIEKTGSREYENAGANRHETRSATMRRAKSCHELGRWRLLGVPPARDYDGVGTLQGPKPGACLDHQATNRMHRAGFQGTHLKVVPLYPQFGTRQTEELHNNTELERTETIVCQRDDAVRMSFRRHGSNLSHIVSSAYRSGDGVVVQFEAILPFLLGGAAVHRCDIELVFSTGFSR